MWATLGIGPVRDERAIRAAYAARLRAGCNPEQDPAGFQVLRAAYERALRWAQSPSEDDRRDPRLDYDLDEDGDDNDDAPEPIPENAPETAPEAAPAIDPDRQAWAAMHAFLERFRTALAQCDGPAAAAAFAEWRATETAYPLDVSITAEQRLLGMLVRADEAAPPVAIHACAMAYDWVRQRERPQQADVLDLDLGPLDEEFGDRVVAARWLARVVEMADAMPPEALPGHPARVAAALLGRTGALPPEPQRHLSRHPVLRRLLQEYGRHGKWLPPPRLAMPDIPGPARVSLLQEALGGNGPVDANPDWLGLLRRPLFVIIVISLSIAGLRFGVFGFDRAGGPSAADTARNTLEQEQAPWITAVTGSDGLMIGYIRLLACRAAIEEAWLTIGTGRAPIRLALPAADPRARGCGTVPDGVGRGFRVASRPDRVTIEVTWKDGTKAPIRTLDLANGPDAR